MRIAAAHIHNGDIYEHELGTQVQSLRAILGEPAGRPRAARASSMVGIGRWRPNFEEMVALARDFLGKAHG
jgi:hypothetical protein